jgi:hypothetical protein
MQNIWDRLLERRFVLLAFFRLVAVALVMPACASGHGTLTVTWTIASISDATLCSKYGAASVAILVNNASGDEYSRSYPSCSALSFTFSYVPSGDYTVTGQMLDASGNTVSNYVGPIGVSLSSGNTATPNIDFPETEFITNPAEASLTVNWTIASSPPNLAQCGTYGAVNLSISLIDPNGNQYGPAMLAACSADTVTIPNLAPGTYTVSARMLNASGQPVSSAVSATNVGLSAGNKATQSFDFPTGSFTN